MFRTAVTVVYIIIRHDGLVQLNMYVTTHVMELLLVFYTVFYNYYSTNYISSKPQNLLIMYQPGVSCHHYFEILHA